MDRSEWLIEEDGNTEIHNGVHFPLCMFTNNARARSQEGADQRSQKMKAKAKAKPKGELSWKKRERAQEPSSSSSDPMKVLLPYENLLASKGSSTAVAEPAASTAVA